MIGWKKAEWYTHKAIELIENTEKDESGN